MLGERWLVTGVDGRVGGGHGVTYVLHSPLQNGVYLCIHGLDSRLAWRIWKQQFIAQRSYSEVKSFFPNDHQPSTEAINCPLQSTRWHSYVWNMLPGNTVAACSSSGNRERAPLIGWTIFPSRHRAQMLYCCPNHSQNCFVLLTLFWPTLHVQSVVTVVQTDCRWM